MLRENLSSETWELIAEILGGVIGTALATYIAAMRAMKTGPGLREPTDIYTVSIDIDEILERAENDPTFAKRIAEALNDDEID